MRLLRQARQAYALLGPPVLRKTLYAIAPFAGDKKAGCRFSDSLFSICKGNPLDEKMALRQPFFSQTPFFRGMSPVPLSLLWVGHSRLPARALSASGRQPKAPTGAERRTVLFVCHWHTAPFSSEKKRKQKIRKPTRLERVSTQASSMKRGLRLPHSVRFQSAPKVSVSRPLFPRVTTFARKQGCWLLLLPRELGADPVRRPRLGRCLQRTDRLLPSNLSGFLLSGR